MIMTPILDFEGKSVGQFLALFLLGFFILSEDALIERLEKHRWLLLAISIILLISFLVIYYVDLDYGIVFDIYYYFIMWMCILAILGMGKHFLNFSNRITTYLAKASFPIYFFHQTWLVAIAFYVFKFTSITAIQFVMIVVLSVSFTFLNYELFRRIPLTRFMFGIKK